MRNRLSMWLLAANLLAACGAEENVDLTIGEEIAIGQREPARAHGGDQFGCGRGSPEPGR